jgi:hypothetical protein
MKGEDLKKLLCYVYNNGYQAGHYDTVEGGYTDVMFVDFTDYYEKETQELLAEFLSAYVYCKVT